MDCEPDLTFAGGQNSQIHIPGSSCPFDFELEKLRKEEESSRKSFEEERSILKAEREREIPELRSEYDQKLQELDVKYNMYAMENNALQSAVKRNSLLANAFVSKYTDPGAATNLRSVRARTSQSPIQQWQRNTNMNSTASPPVRNQSGPLLYFPRSTMTSTPFFLPLATARALSPLSNTTWPRPPPLISNYLTPNASPSAYGKVRTPAPHLQRFRGSRVPNASVMYPKRLAQEQRQQQRNSNGGELVCLSDDDE